MAAAAGRELSLGYGLGALAPRGGLLRFPDGMVAGFQEDEAECMAFL